MVKELNQTSDKIKQWLRQRFTRIHLHLLKNLAGLISDKDLEGASLQVDRLLLIIDRLEEEVR